MLVEEGVRWVDKQSKARVTVVGSSMIHLTRINQRRLVLNSDLIEQIEATPDTVITMTNGQKLVVTDSAEAVIEKIIAFRRSIQQIPSSPVGGLPPEAEE